MLMRAPLSGSSDSASPVPHFGLAPLGPRVASALRLVLSIEGVSSPFIAFACATMISRQGLGDRLWEEPLGTSSLLRRLGVDLGGRGPGLLRGRALGGRWGAWFLDLLGRFLLLACGRPRGIP